MKYAIVIPCMSMVHTQFMSSLVGMSKPAGTRVIIAESSLIYDARNSLGLQALELGCDRMLWLDSDMVFSTDLMDRLSADLDAGRDFVSALYFTRKPPIKPVIFRNMEVVRDDAGRVTVDFDRIYDYPKDGVFPISACGFGACMMTTELFKAVMDKYGSPFAPYLGMGEDMAFCRRAQETGAVLYCDSGIRPRHIGLYGYSEKDMTRDGQRQ